MAADPNLDRVRQFARAVRGDLASRAEPATGQSIAQAGVARSNMLAGATPQMRKPRQPRDRYADQARALVRQRTSRLGLS